MTETKGIHTRQTSFVYGCLLTMLLAGASCTTQQLPDGAYVPARVRQSAPTTVTITPPTPPRPAQMSQEAARAATALGITADKHDDATLLSVCASYLGVPYRYAGNDRSGLDCSGLTTRIYREVYGVGLHRRSIDQFQKDIVVRHDAEPQQGDLVFFPTNGRGTCSHVGIYLKAGHFIHASTRRGVVVDKLSSSYFSTRYLGCGSPLRR